MPELDYLSGFGGLITGLILKKKRRIKMLRITISAMLILLTTSCGSLGLLPVTRLPEGNVKRLSEMPEFQNVKESSEDVKRWAKEALHSVNDLEYQLRRQDD